MPKLKNVLSIGLHVPPDIKKPEGKETMGVLEPGEIVDCTPIQAAWALKNEKYALEVLE